jgi:YD repeat-containing protein
MRRDRDTGPCRQSWWLALLLSCACAAPVRSAVAPQPPRATPAEEVLWCAGTVLEHDVPRCLWQLTPEQQRRRPDSARLLFRRGQVARLDSVSGSGAPHGLSRVYEHRAGRVAGWSLENRNGVVKGRDVLSDQARWERWLDEQDRPRPLPRTSVSGARRRLDERGRVARQAWVSWLGTPTAEGAVYETRSKRSAAGALLERSFFGARGEPVNDPSGAHRVVYAVDARGVELSRRYFDAAGQPALVDGVHEARTSSDAFGSPVTTSYFDAQGRPARDTRDGAAALRYDRDERGNALSVALLDERGLSTLGSRGWATKKHRYDELDAVIETSFFGVNGEPARDLVQGAATLRLLRSERGNVVSELSFDEQGAPTLGAGGYHRVDVEYDQRDNAASYVYSDTGGVALRSRRLFYDGDRLIREEHVGANGKPLRTEQGYASYETSYRDDGSEGPPLYFDEDGGQRVSCNGAVPPALQTELAERAGSLRSCYERLLRYGSTEEGKLLIELSIDARGQVLNAKLVQDGIDDGDLSKCVLETMRVPYLHQAEGDCATVRVPVAFRQKR